MKKDSAVHVKSYAFALRVVRLYQYLTSEKREYVLSKQLLRSGTAVGALVRESEHGQSKADFIHKLQIALKEANESLYWIELLHDAGYLNVDGFDSLYPQAEELVKLLVSIIKTSKLRIAPKVSRNPSQRFKGLIWRVESFGLAYESGKA